jgi:FkbM family methyltransferase
MAAAPTGLDAFLDDIAPYFYRRALTYVDIGAFRGEVLEHILKSKLRVREAHLVEPNPASLAQARERLAGQFKGQRLEFHAMAMGAEPGRVRMSAARDMTKVLSDAASAADGGSFEIECGTLDRLAENVTDRHIGLLKVDVEGFEDRVLAGAAGLLARGDIDVIYIEAGMNPEGTQQCYYRRIEDILVAHGYRLFRIYEQQHEWMADSPLLRRVNMAFFSRRFADANPYRLTQELVKTQEALQALQTRADELDAARTRLRCEVDTLAQTGRDLRGANTRLQHDLAALRKELDEARRARRQLDAELGASRLRLERLEQKDVKLETVLAGAVHALGEMGHRAANTQAAAAAAQHDLERVERSRVVRVGRAVATNVRSPRRWLALLPAVLEASQRPPRPAVAPGSPADPRLPALQLGGRRAALTLPIGRQAQTVVLPASPTPYSVWVTGFVADLRRSPRLDVSWREQSAADAGVELLAEDGTARRLLPGGLASVELPIGQLRCLLRVAAAGAPFALDFAGHGSSRAAFRLHVHPGGSDTPPAFADALRATRAPGRIAMKTGAGTDTGPTVEELNARLWGGYATDALAELEARKRDAQRPPAEREGAAWFIARWYFVEQQMERALAEAAEARAVSAKPRYRVLLLEVQALLALGRVDQAETVLADLRRLQPRDPLDAILLQSTVAREQALARGAARADAEQAQLDALNEIYRRGGLAPLERRDATQPLSLANLAAQAHPTGRPQTRKVSIVIPAYNAEGSIGWVIDSLLAQTWRNLEVIVVDDCSSDTTADVVARIAERDPRVRLLRKDVNEGAYPTRNAGARLATGDYLTVHDSDDWSHPQKIELQVAALESHPDRKAVVTHWVRVGEGLEIVGPWVPWGSLFDINLSSMMFERTLFERLGPWDAVKISADAEFYYRLRALYGEASVLKLPTVQLLSLSLTREDSLTRSKATHLRSLYYGLRWNYRDAYSRWNEQLASDQDARIVDAATGRRRFPVPIGCLPKKPASLDYGLVVVGDFAEADEPLRRAIGCLEAASAAGRRVAVVNWRKYERTARAPLQASFYAAVLRTGADILSPGDRVRADLVVVVEAALAEHRIDPLPELRTARVLAVVDAAPVGPAVLAVERVQAHLQAVFGVAPVLVASVADPSATEQLRRWLPQCAVRAAAAPAVTPASAPRLGRIGSGHAIDWPEDPGLLRRAHADGTGWTFTVFGEVASAAQAGVGLPADWRVHADAEVSGDSLAAAIDVYVHQPAGGAPVVVTQGIAQAMAAGVPVVVPQRFRAVLGDAAVYAEPDAVAATVRALWSDAQEYAAVGARAREFVRRECSHEALLRRTAEAPVAQPAGAALA